MKLKLQMEKKSFLIMVMILFLILIVNMASAGIWDDILKLFSDEKTINNTTKIYDETIKEVTITDLELNNITKIKLLTPINYKVASGYQKVAEYEINSLENLKILVSNMEFYDLNDNMKQIDRTIDYKIKGYKLTEINETICDDYIKKINCSNKIFLANKTIWTDLFKFDFEKDEKITIGLFTNVGKYDKIEWIPTFQINDNQEVRIEEWAEWETVIIMGNPATDRAQAQNGGMTFVDRLTPANDTGTITHVEIFLASDVTNLEVATFSASGNDLTTRDNETIGSASSGLQNFSVDLEVESGDFIGVTYADGGTMEFDSPGGASWYYVGGDGIPCSGLTFNVGVHTWSLRGYGVIEIVENTAPTITANVTSPSTVYSNTDFKLNLTITDIDADTLTGYVQFYINGTLTGAEQSQEVINNTNTLIGTLDNGNFSLSYTLIAEYWAGDGTDNTTRLNTTQVSVYTKMGGTVKDSSNIVVNNAKVIIINQVTNTITGTTDSNSTGGWTYNTAVAGTYLVVAYDPNNSTRDGDADPHIVVS